MNLRHVASGAARLACTVAGEGPAVVILHAGVADRRGYASLVEALAPDHHVVAYDRRGFGESVAEPEGYSEVEDLRAVLDAFAIGSATLVGNSRGGAIALDFALTHPDRVRALVLLGPAVNGAPDLPSTPEVAAMERALEAAEGDVDATNLLEARIWLDGVPFRDQPRVTGAPRELFLAMNHRALTARSPGTAQLPSPTWPRLAAIGCPTTVVLGRRDLPEVVSVGEAVAMRIPGARVVHLEDSAHLPALDAPTALAAVVRASLHLDRG